MNKAAIIDAVFVRPAIWDRRHQNHHTGVVLIKLWKEVAAECQLEEKLVKTTWKRLRETFRKKLGEQLMCEASGQLQNCTWQYFDALYFLHDQMTPLLPPGDTSSATDSKQFLLAPQSEVDIKTEVFNEEKYTYIDVPSPVDLREISPIPSAHSSNSSSTKRKRTFEEEIPTDEAEHENFENSTKRYKQVDEDEDVAFFDSILPHVRALTAKQKLKFRIRVLQVLEEDIPTIE